MMAQQVQVDPTKARRAARIERKRLDSDERDEWLERAWKRANAAKRKKA